MEPNLDQAYASLQQTLRAGYLADLEELRQALLNSMSNQPDKASRMQPKLQNIDVAIQLFKEEYKTGVTTADMSRLMNMSAKIGKAIETYRAKKAPRVMQLVPQQQQEQQPPGFSDLQQRAATQVQPQTQPAQQQQQHLQQQQQQQNGSLLSEQVAPPASAQLPTETASPFSQQQQQQQQQQTTGSGGQEATAHEAAHVAGISLAVLEGLDGFDFLAALVGTDSTIASVSDHLATELPSIDWEVPEVRPSGNLDSLLASEASEVLLQQQLATEAVRRRSAPLPAGSDGQRAPSPAEAWLARVAQQQQQQQPAGGATLPAGQMGPPGPPRPAGSHTLYSRRSWDGTIPTASMATLNSVGTKRQLVQHSSLPSQTHPPQLQSTLSLRQQPQPQLPQQKQKQQQQQQEQQQQQQPQQAASQQQPHSPLTPAAEASAMSTGSGGGSVSMVSGGQQQEGGDQQQPSEAEKRQQRAAATAKRRSVELQQLQQQQKLSQQQATLIHLQQLQQQQAAAMAAACGGMQLQQQHMAMSMPAPSGMMSPTYSHQTSASAGGSAMDWQAAQQQQQQQLHMFQQRQQHQQTQQHLLQLQRQQQAHMLAQQQAQQAGSMMARLGSNGAPMSNGMLSLAHLQQHQQHGLPALQAAGTGVGQYPVIGALQVPTGLGGMNLSAGGRTIRMMPGSSAADAAAALGSQQMLSVREALPQQFSSHNSIDQLFSQVMRDGRLPGGAGGAGCAPGRGMMPDGGAEPPAMPSAGAHPSFVMRMDGGLIDSGVLPASNSGFLNLAHDLLPSRNLGMLPQGSLGSGGLGPGAAAGALTANGSMSLGAAMPTSSLGSKRSKLS